MSEKPTTSDISKVAVDCHNKNRRLHVDTPDIVWDANLARSAEDYASHLIYEKRGQLKHADVKDFGENLYKGMSSRLHDVQEVVNTAIQKWYDELNAYNYDNPSFQGGTGHFTQVVWKSSTQLGVGCAQAEIDGWHVCIVVGRYRKAGNMRGQFVGNVMPLK